MQNWTAKSLISKSGKGDMVHTHTPQNLSCVPRTVLNTPASKLNVGCLLLNQCRCLPLRQERCLLLRQDRCLLLGQDRCLLLKQDRCLLVRQGAALSHYFKFVLSHQKASVLSQQQTSVLSQQQTSVPSPQKTSLLSRQTTSGCFGVILGRTKMISTLFLHQKVSKCNTDHGADGAGGATETTPPAAPRTLIPYAPGARIT